MGLDETLYGTMRLNLLAQDPLPNLNKIYSTLVQEEHVKTVVSTKEERGEVMSFAVNTSPRSYGRCDRIEENQCTNCGRGGGVKANVVQSSTSGARSNDVVSDMERAAVTGLNNDRWETLKNIMNATKIRVNEKLTNNDGNEVRHSVNHEEEQSVDQVFNYVTNASINDEEAQNVDPVKSVPREGPNDTQHEEYLGRGHRNKVPSTRLKDFVTDTVHTSGPSTSSFVPSESSGFEPQTFKEAMKDENWRSADEVFSTWMAFGGNTLRRDNVTGIKRHRHDLSGDGVRNLAMTSGRSRLKEDLESSTWRRRQDFKATSSQRFSYIY
ncbi:hypothetical protein Tco_0538248 [Tanacetum coccineum]